jgi:hypothetical protein
MRGRDVVILQHARAVESGEGIGHRRWQREMEDGDVSPPRRRILERPRLATHVFIDGERKQVGFVSHRLQQPPHAPRTVADRIAAMSRRNPLVDNHENFRFAICDLRLNCNQFKK